MQPECITALPVTEAIYQVEKKKSLAPGKWMTIIRQAIKF